MKIIVVGATGTIGSAVTKELGARHDIVKVGGGDEWRCAGGYDFIRFYSSDVSSNWEN
jgi:nucleoside-diphosphate-sugar epimerase